MTGLARAASLVAILALAGCGSEGGNEAAGGVQVVTPHRTTTPPPAGLPTAPPPARPTRAPTSPLEVIQLGAVGRWSGQATVLRGEGPFYQTPGSWTMWIDFHENGHYAAGCVDTMCRAALHVGNDGEWAEKRYAFYDLAADDARRGLGEIYVLHGGGPLDSTIDGMTAQPILRRAELLDVRLSDDAMTLAFVLEYSQGTVRYSLRRLE